MKQTGPVPTLPVRLIEASVSNLDLWCLGAVEVLRHDFWWPFPSEPVLPVDLQKDGNCVCMRVIV